MPSGYRRDKGLDKTSGGNLTVSFPMAVVNSAIFEKSFLVSVVRGNIGKLQMTQRLYPRILLGM